MSPGEHALSQRVLEFLIAQQDWFMLDIPPPPTQQLGGPPRPFSDLDDFTVVPSSDDEQPQVGGGWKLIGRDRPTLPRRRTTVESSGELLCCCDVAWYTYASFFRFSKERISRRGHVACSGKPV